MQSPLDVLGRTRHSVGPRPVGRRLELSFRLPRPGGGGDIAASAEVVRAVSSLPDSHQIPGMGVRFLELDAAAKEADE